MMGDMAERRVYTRTIRGTGEEELAYGQERAQRRAVRDGVPEWVVPAVRREYVDAAGNRTTQDSVTTVETIVDLRWEWEAESITARRWYDYQGGLVELPDDVPLTMYDGLNHRIRVWDGGQVGQMLTGCGKRACPGPTRQVPGRGPVDCPECVEADRD